MNSPMVVMMSVFLLLPSPASSPWQHPDAAQIVGTWRLVQIETKSRSTGARIDSLSGTKVSGILMYDSGGNMSVQVKREWRPNIPYVAYFGTYTVDAKAGTVIHHVQMSTNDYKGTDQVRAYRFEDGGKRLVLTPVNAPDVSSDVIMQLTWQRAH